MTLCGMTLDAKQTITHLPFHSTLHSSGTLQSFLWFGTGGNWFWKAEIKVSNLTGLDKVDFMPADMHRSFEIRKGITTEVRPFTECFRDPPVLFRCIRRQCCTNIGTYKIIPLVSCSLNLTKLPIMTGCFWMVESLHFNCVASRPTITGICMSCWKHLENPSPQ